MTNTLETLFATLQSRHQNPVAGSYTNQLLEEGLDRILQKIGEESVEVILAAKGQGQERLISELADLTYHCLVLLVQQGLSLDDISTELKRRHQPK